MSLAEIIDNIPRCRRCGSICGAGTGEYRQILHCGESYTEFKKYCSNPKCNEKLTYYAIITLDGVTRYSFDKDIEAIKEDKNDDSNN